MPKEIKKEEIKKAEPKKEEKAQKELHKEKKEEVAKKEGEQKGAVKKEKKVKKRNEKVILAKVSASKEIKKLREKRKKLKGKLKFRGRFGSSGIRRKANKKWQKWRFPRGIDIKFERENNPYPSIGRGLNGEIRGMHPSGFNEILIHNEKGLEGLDKNVACRISGTIGKRKKIGILKKANELKVKILNP